MTKQQKQKHCEKLLAYYQPLLRLQDWDIGISVLDNIEYVTRHGVDFGNSRACNEITTLTKESHIFIREEGEDDSIAECIIHELVHLMIQHQWRYANDSFVEITNTDLAETVVKEHNLLLEGTVAQVSKAIICCLLFGGKFKL